MRRDLRAKGRLLPAPRDKQAQRVAERQAEEHATSARFAEARDEVAQHEAESARKPRTKPRVKPRDLTMLLLIGMTAIAAPIFYLSQRGPSADEVDTAPAPGATTTAKGAPPR
jgi:hypothetical protein